MSPDEVNQERLPVGTRPRNDHRGHRSCGRCRSNLTGTGEEWAIAWSDVDVDYGFGRAIFRTTSMFAASGACITYVGPLGFFDGQPQLKSTTSIG